MSKNKNAENGDDNLNNNLNNGSDTSDEIKYDNNRWFWNTGKISGFKI